MSEKKPFTTQVEASLITAFRSACIGQNSTASKQIKTYMLNYVEQNGHEGLFGQSKSKPNTKFLELTEEIWDNQHENYELKFLDGASVGEWGFYDGVIYLSECFLRGWTYHLPEDGDEEMITMAYETLHKLNSNLVSFSICAKTNVATFEI